MASEASGSRAHLRQFIHVCRSIGEQASASWIIVFTTQTLAIVLTVNLYDRVRNLREQRGWCDGAAANESVSPFAFDLRTLMLWTTVIAFALGFVQFARAKWQWTFSIADWEFWP